MKSARGKQRSGVVETSRWSALAASRSGSSPRALVSRSSGLAVSALGLLPSSQVLAQQLSDSGSQGSYPTSVGEAVQEIVVTAQRRSERLADVPYNISAVTSDQLAASGTSNANDIGNVVVGLNTVNEGPVSLAGNNGYTLRGLRSDPAAPSLIPQQSVNSVSTYFGDTPLFFPVLLKDIDRVEVLRGPQGTLYGSGAEGGTIRFIPARPIFDKLSGELNTSGSFTKNAVHGNYSFDGVVNVPLADDFAVRLVGAYTRQAGFIDKVDRFEVGADRVPVRSVQSDITSGPVLAPVERGANDSEQWQVRPEVRYHPTDWLDLEVDYLHQRSHAADQQYTNPTYAGGLVDFSAPGYPVSSSDGLFPNSSFTSRAGGRLANTMAQFEATTATLDLVSGTASADLGFATLTSVTSYSKAKTHSGDDASPNYIVQVGSGVFSYLPDYNFYPRFSAPTETNVANKGFTEEVRLVSEPGKPITYVLGSYYEKRDTDSSFFVDMPGIYAYSAVVCPNTPACLFTAGANPGLGDVVYTSTLSQQARDIAIFGEVTYHPTSKWQLTGGFRFFWDKVEASVFNTAPFFGAVFGDGVTAPQEQGAVGAASSQSISDHIFKINTSYNLTPDSKVYATYSRGFRRGGANTLPITGGFASLPTYATFQPDFANNFEVGLKGEVLNRTVSYSLSAYLINLRNFQIDGYSPSLLPAVFNGDLARSKGIEAEFSWRATSRLALSAGYSLTDSTVVRGSTFRDYYPGTLLTDPNNPVIVDGMTIAKGAKLPGVSRHTFIGAADYSIPLPHDASVILHANVSYRSSQNSTIDVSSPAFALIPATTRADLRITYDTGQKWSVSGFVNNVSNAIGYSGAAGLQTLPYLYQKWLVSTPRTVGADVRFEF